MWKELALSIVISGIITFFSTWFIARHYYKKSLRQMADEFSKQISELLDSTKQASDINRQILIQKRIEESVEECRRSGTPVRAIDTYDMSNEEKADLLDKVMLRVKGRKPKNNKYRSGQ